MNDYDEEDTPDVGSDELTEEEEYEMLEELDTEAELETPPAEEILEDAFGKNDKKYTIEYGDGWVEADIQESGDCEAYHIHISYQSMAGYAFLTQTIVLCSFPYRKAYDEIIGNDEPTENGDVGYDFREEVSDECRALFGGNGGTEDFSSNSDIDFGDEDSDWSWQCDDPYRTIVISVEIGSDEEERSALFGLDDINEDLKKLKEIIDSYKKK